MFHKPAALLPTGITGQHALSWLERNFEISHGSKKAILSMEGIRGVGCILVFLAHYCLQFSSLAAADPALAMIAHYVRHAGELALDLFFLMSGYLIYAILLRRKTTLVTYLQRRITRIYPTFLFVFCGYLLLFFLLPTRNKLPSELPAATYYVIQNLILLPGIFDIKPIISVAWTLSYEMCFYLLAPLAVSLFRLREAIVSRRLAILVTFSSATFAAFILLGGPIRMMSFVAGMLVLELHQYTQFRVPRYTGIVAVTVAYLGVAFGRQLGLSPAFISVASYCCQIAFGLDCFVQRGTDAVFRVKWFRWMGSLSYSFYLTHALVVQVCLTVCATAFPASFGRLAFGLLWLPVFAVALVIGGITFLFVEKPFSLARRPEPVQANNARRAAAPSGTPTNELQTSR